MLPFEQDVYTVNSMSWFFPLVLSCLLMQSGNRVYNLLL